MKKITFLFLSFISLGIFFSCNTDDTGGITDAIHFDTAYLSCELGMETAILLNDTIYVLFGAMVLGFIQLITGEIVNLVFSPR